MSFTCVRLGTLILMLSGVAVAADLPLPSMAAPGSDVVSVHRLRHPAPAEAAQELQLAEKALVRDELQSSVEHLERAISLYPHYTEAYSELGAVLLRLNESGRAVVAMEKAVASDPASVAVRLNLGLTQLRANRLEDAERTVRQAIVLDPRSNKARYLLAVILEKQGYREAAASELQDYLKLNGLTYRAAAETWLAKIDR
jgi:Flp pilus assembly protein TadD